MNDEPVRYETVEAELQRLIDRLYQADETTVRTEAARLHALADQVEDEAGRERAHRRANQLPRLLAGPRVATSEQFRQAQQLLDQALNSTGTPQQRLAEVEASMDRIGQLADDAPGAEAGAIRRMTSTLLRLADHLEASR
ncbi:hypothetical protein FB561_0528 [Kribbella amoyensis]|uniref:Uncharacterized protein n=1 Tax=Kribbella amoyensis TaxID=996641 RepID=A0A561BKS3_9ACTN|nr:hypothetical protein [Kribbella amoyensis]TWD79469.1 hypothetical protein FB561_0528 [Kribbella amoyensis]